MITSKYTIRNDNKSLILKTIIENEPISRSELSTMTGLNKASVSSIIKDLLEQELVNEIGIGDASNIGGRKPILLSFNKRSSLIISLDISFNYLKGVISYINGEIIHHYNDINTTINSHNIITKIMIAISELERHILKTPHGIIGVCIGVHGIVFNNKIIFAPYYDIDKVNIFSELSKICPYPIFIENEANLAALGEYTFSSKYDNLIGISIHSGIGAGIIKKGEIQYGNMGKTGEIGHSILYPNGIVCPCGNRGCLEQYASDTVVYKEFANMKRIKTYSPEIIREYYETDDEDTIKFINEISLYLSIGINNIITMNDPEIVVVNSELLHEIPNIINLIDEKIKSQFSIGTKIMLSSLQGNSTLLGGISLVAQNFLNITDLKIIYI